MRQWVCLLFLLAVPLAHAAQTPEDFAYAQPIAVQGASGLARIALPAQVYQGCVVAPLADIRVVDSAGQNVPFAREPRTQHSAPGRRIGLTFYPIYGRGPVAMDHAHIKLSRRGQEVSVEMDGAAVPRSERTLQGYLIDLKRLSAPLVGLEVSWQTGEENQLLSLDVDASEDLQNWRRLLEKSTLASMRFNGQSLLQDSVEFASTKAAYLRISFGGEGPVPLVTGVHGREGSALVEAPRLWQEYNPTRSNSEGVEFDLSGELPLERLQLLAEGDNVLLPLEVQSRKKESDPWVTQAAQTFYRIQQRGRAITSPEIALPAVPRRYWRLRATGSATLPASLRIRVGWAPESLVFVMQGVAPFRLIYGNAGARNVALPITSVVPGYGGEGAPQIVTATLGSQQILAGPSAQKKRIDYKAAVLWGALVVGVMLLGWMAWSLARQMKR